MYHLPEKSHPASAADFIFMKKFSFSSEVLNFRETMTSSLLSQTQIFQKKNYHDRQTLWIAHDKYILIRFWSRSTRWRVISGHRVRFVIFYESYHTVHHPEFKFNFQALKQRTIIEYEIKLYNSILSRAYRD